MEVLPGRSRHMIFPLRAYQLKAMEDTLSNAWHMATALSNSTILGGRSWLGFTTLLSGIRIDNHPAYEDMISHHVGYPHLINTLNAQGYHNLPAQHDG